MKTGASGKQRVTSADVARASGVSRATVSYVLNNDPRQTIPPETRERVRKTAQMLGYSPFVPARILRSGQSLLVLAVLPFEQIDPGLSRRVKEIEQKLAAHGLTLICYVGVHPQTGTTHPSANVTPCVLLSYADQTDPIISAFLKQFRVPVLQLIGDAKIQERIGWTQANYLIQRGKHSLIFATSEREDVHFLSQHRLNGVRQACTQWGLADPAVCAIPSSREGARTVLRNLLLDRISPRGICCYNDEVAFAVLAALADEDIAIPMTAAVIGCDNIPLSQFSVPALTTVAFDDERSLDPLIEAIVTLCHGGSIPWVPQETLAIIQRASA